MDIMNQLLNKKLKIENMIYEVRGKQVKLSSYVAAKVNIQIINAFVKMRNIYQTVYFQMI